MVFQELPTRRFLWLPVAFGVGIGAYFFLNNEPSKAVVAALCVGALLLFLINHIGRIRFYSIYALCFVVFGFSLMFFRTHYLNTFMIDDFYKDIHLSGIIHTIEDKEDDFRLLIDDISLDSSVLETYPLLSNIRKIRLKVSKSAMDEAFKNKRMLVDSYKFQSNEGAQAGGTIIPGMLLHVKATLVPFQGPIYPNGLDMRRQAYFDGVSAQGRIKEIKTIGSGSRGAFSWRFFDEKLNTYRYALTQALLKHLPRKTAGIGAALITGDRSYISKEMRQHFVDAGIAHILAISGLHLSIIAGFVFFMIRGSLALFPSIVERYPIKKIAALCVIFLSLCYLLISGTGYPVQRAFAMTSLVMVAIILDQRAITMRLLAFAAFIVLIIKPESLLSASFQLSFSAVVALIAFYETGWKILYEWGRYGGVIRKSITYVAGIMTTTIIATLATTPFTIFFFNRFTLQSLVGNLLAIPLTGVCVMPLAFLAVMSLLWGGSALIFKLFHLSLQTLQQVAMFTASLPGAAILIPSPPPWVLYIIIFGGLWLCLWQTRLRYAGVVPVVFGFCLFSIDQTPDILVSKNLMAYKDKNILHASSSKGWFERAMWKKHLGMDKDVIWDERIYRKGSYLFIESPKKLKISALRNEMHKDGVKIIVTAGYLPRFIQSDVKKRLIQLYDRTTLKKGIYGIWLKDTWHHKNGIYLLTSHEKRPWTLSMNGM